MALDLTSCSSQRPRGHPWFLFPKGPIKRFKRLGDFLKGLPRIQRADSHKTHISDDKESAGKAFGSEGRTGPNALGFFLLAQGYVSFSGLRGQDLSDEL